MSGKAITRHLPTVALRGVAAFLIALAACLLHLARPAEASAANRPSFVLIQLDDFATLHLDGRRVDALGRSFPTMPNTRRLLLSQGVRFTNYQAPTPICAPSRASLLSGRYASNHPVKRNANAWPTFRDDRVADENLAVWLRDGGYRTMHFGKFINRYSEPDGYPTTVVPPGWDVWQADADDESTREYYGYFLNLNGTIGGPFGSPAYGPGTIKDPEGCPDLGLEACDYHTDAITTRAISEIEGTPSSQPFMVHLGYHTPHSDSRPPAGPEPAVRHLGSGSSTPRPDPPNYDERNVSDKPPWIRVSPRLGSGTASGIRTRFRKSVEALRSVDESVGRLVESLREAGRLDETYFFLFADNGYLQGEHRLVRGKGWPYEPSVRVPMVVRGPGVPRGRSSTELTGNMDIAPTLLSLAGTDAGRSIDGRPMVRFWERPGSLSRRPVLLEYFADLSDGTAPVRPGAFYRGIRLGPYKFVRYRTGARELYDLARDPHELRNRVRDPRYDRVERYMARQLDRFRGCAGADCRGTAPKWPSPRPARR